MTTIEAARAYCEALGLDPDEEVCGYALHFREGKARFSQPRWRWMLGATPALAEGACELSPAQRAIGRGAGRL